MCSIYCRQCENDYAGYGGAKPDSSIFDARPSQFQNSVPSECQAFQGNLLVRTGDNQMQNVVSFHEYSTVLGRNISNCHFLNMVYLAPFDHLRGGNFTRILTNESYKELCIQILQLFDPGITDLLLLKNENTNRPIECVKHKDMERCPLSSYGDGIKKVLSIASGIAKAVNGVLLIDEVETAIHSRYFEDIFPFSSPPHVANLMCRSLSLLIVSKQLMGFFRLQITTKRLRKQTQSAL